MDEVKLDNTKMQFMYREWSLQNIFVSHYRLMIQKKQRCMLISGAIGVGVRVRMLE